MCFARNAGRFPVDQLILKRAHIRNRVFALRLSSLNIVCPRYESNGVAARRDLSVGCLYIDSVEEVLSKYSFSSNVQGVKLHRHLANSGV